MIYSKSKDCNTLHATNIRESAVKQEHYDKIKEGVEEWNKWNLIGANLSDADLIGANLSDADLSGANLSGANLIDANLSDASLIDAKHLTPTMILLANWGRCSPNTTLQLMRLDASAHPDPASFDRWATATGGCCPYSVSRFMRVACFSESRELWQPGPPPTVYEAMCMVLDEHCPTWGDAPGEETTS